MTNFCIAPEFLNRVFFGKAVSTKKIDCTGGGWGGGQANAFVPYIGVGAIGASGTHSDYFTRDNENFAFAAQEPLGFEFLPSPERFDIFTEIAPSIEITPAAAGFVTANLGAEAARLQAYNAARLKGSGRDFVEAAAMLCPQDLARQSRISEWGWVPEDDHISSQKLWFSFE